MNWELEKSSIPKLKLIHSIRKFAHVSGSVLLILESSYVR